MSSNSVLILDLPLSFQCSLGKGNSVTKQHWLGFMADLISHHVSPRPLNLCFTLGVHIVSISNWITDGLSARTNLISFHTNLFFTRFFYGDLIGHKAGRALFLRYSGQIQIAVRGFLFFTHLLGDCGCWWPSALLIANLSLSVFVTPFGDRVPKKTSCTSDNILWRGSKIIKLKPFFGGKFLIETSESALN